MRSEPEHHHKHTHTPHFLFFVKPPQGEREVARLHAITVAHMNNEDMRRETGSDAWKQEKMLVERGRKPQDSLVTD